MKSLSEFPRDLLPEIARHLSSSEAILNLWKSGDCILQRKLEQSITSLDLEDLSYAPSSRWPKCLSRFRRLRSLSLTIKHGQLCDGPHHLQSALLLLSHELEELTIDSKDFLFSPDENADAPPLLYFEDPSAFGRLSKISVRCQQILLTSPKSSFFDFLMRNVRCITALEGSTTSFAQSSDATLHWRLPPNIERLGAARLTKHFSADELPPSLTRIDSINLASWNSALLTHLSVYQPSHLEFWYWVPEIAYSCPPSVTSITMDYHDRFDSSIDAISALPRTLRSLKADTLREVDWDVLPPSLTHLSALNSYGWVTRTSMSLKHLTTLEVNEVSPIFISSLPPTLTSLRFKLCAERELPALPASLTLLDSSADVLISVPPNLRKLKIPRLYSNKRSLLPATLTNLECDGSLIRRDANCTVSNVTTAIIKDFSETLFPYLPRGLTRLSINKLHLNSKATRNPHVHAWSKLPQSLRVMHVDHTYYSGVPPECLIRLVNLRHIYFPFFTADAAMCAVLRDHMPELRSITSRLGHHSRSHP